MSEFTLPRLHGVCLLMLILFLVDWHRRKHCSFTGIPNTAHICYAASLLTRLLCWPFICFYSVSPLLSHLSAYILFLSAWPLTRLHVCMHICLYAYLYVNLHALAILACAHCSTPMFLRLLCVPVCSCLRSHGSGVLYAIDSDPISWLCECQDSVC